MSRGGGRGHRGGGGGTGSGAGTGRGAKLAVSVAPKAPDDAEWSGAIVAEEHVAAIMEFVWNELRKPDAKCLTGSSDGIKASTELIRLFVEEAISRAMVVASLSRDDPDNDENDEKVTITPEHLEKILPQLLLDFF
ncbi:hypothetical protein Pelo_4594 [Pelomyxa schiedti]|nr:hypothetical protein Pelo_4594 [Pelomyxa schiedti]